MCTDCKPWAITALIEANLLQLSEIAQKCKENEIPVIVQFDYDMGEWHNPTENTRSFGLCINEETSSMFAFDDNIDE